MIIIVLKQIWTKRECGLRNLFGLLDEREYWEERNCQFFFFEKKFV